MLKYVFIPNEEYSNDAIMFSAEDQCWDENTLCELKDKYNVIFMTNGDGVIPVMISKRWGIILGTEDDGTIQFPMKYGQPIMSFSEYFTEDLIADLQEALRISKNNKQNSLDK